MRQAARRCCVHCGQGFMPDPRNARHQRYCGSAPCKAASKRASQEKWLAKPENQNYFRGPEAVARVKAWREDHPGYSRRPEPPGNVPVQEDLPLESPPAEPSQAEEIAPPQISCNALPGKPATPLQDLLNAQPIVLIGLIAHLFDATLQDSIGETLHRLIQLGLDIRGGRSDEYDETAMSTAQPSSPQTDRTKNGRKSSTTTAPSPPPCLTACSITLIPW